MATCAPWSFNPAVMIIGRSEVRNEWRVSLNWQVDQRMSDIALITAVLLISIGKSDCTDVFMAFARYASLNSSNASGLVSLRMR